MDFPRALRAVIAGTVASGIAGGAVGAALGGLAPTFVLWLVQSMQGRGAPPVDPLEFGLGCGAVAGLLLGALASTAIAFAAVRRGAKRADVEIS